MAELKSQVTFRVSDEIYETINDIAIKERRKQNEAARALLERGVAAYNRDGLLFEPTRNNGTLDNDNRANEHPKDAPRIETEEGRRSRKRGHKTGR
ncbi:MAG TPA: hypothetical protein VJS44_04765 [Pyrinomonadaceae bacterium]|nr:hypothetical protein [Pyrinomonadaceae bacterium]